MKSYEARSVKKAFAILNTISTSRNGIGISEIARKLKIAKSTAHGIARALEEVGAVIRDPHSKRYELGFTPLEIGRRAYAQMDLLSLTRPFMEKLMQKTRTSVFLGTLNLDSVIIFDSVESRQDLKITAPIGASISLLSGAVGKVFLAFMESEKAREIVEAKRLPRFTDNSIVEPSRYFKELETVRTNGYALDDEEYIMGVRSAAAPITGLGQLKSAVWSVGFKAGLDGKRMISVAIETRKAAKAISRKFRKQLLL